MRRRKQSVDGTQISVKPQSKLKESTKEKEKEAVIKRTWTLDKVFSNRLWRSKSDTRKQFEEFSPSTVETPTSAPVATKIVTSQSMGSFQTNSTTKLSRDPPSLTRLVSDSEIDENH
jgi:hypothetical protein